MSPPFIYPRTVSFAETDMAGIVHFSNFFRYMEEAEHAFLRSMGFSVHGTIDAELIAFPRVDVSCVYKAPLRFEDEFQIELTVTNRRDKAVTYGFTFRKADGSTIATGSTTAVCATRDSPESPLRSIPIPLSLANALDAAADR